MQGSSNLHKPLTNLRTHMLACAHGCNHNKSLNDSLVEVLTKDFDVYVIFTYWFIKYQNIVGVMK